MCSTSSRTRSGARAAAGRSTRPPCMARPSTICPGCCAGSPPISAFTTCIICAAGFPITGCRGCCATIRICARSAGSPWESLGSVRLVLWDERQRRLISFREARQSLPEQTPALFSDMSAETPQAAGGGNSI